MTAERWRNVLCHHHIVRLKQAAGVYLIQLIDARTDAIALREELYDTPRRVKANALNGGSTGPFAFVLALGVPADRAQSYSRFVGWSTVRVSIFQRCQTMLLRADDTTAMSTRS
jgi:hypothetical protein